MKTPGSLDPGVFVSGVFVSAAGGYSSAEQAHHWWAHL
jgi:hypothetical protein